MGNLLVKALRRMMRPFDAALQIQYRQMEAYIALCQMLKSVRPLPPMRGSAISPDAAVLLADLILDYRPKTIVELGSGVSTIIGGYCLKNFGIKGHIYSLDHEEFFAGITRSNLIRHGVHEQATIFHAPLKEYDILGQKYSWYATDALAHIGDIDLLVIDGPPRGLNPKVRFPALPLLKDKLAAKAVIFLDDAARADELASAGEWRSLYPNAIYEEIPLEKGALVVYWK